MFNVLKNIDGDVDILGYKGQVMEFVEAKQGLQFLEVRW
jgi:hypothetical protein